MMPWSLRDPCALITAPVFYAIMYSTLLVEDLMTSMGQNHKLPGVLLNRHFSLELFGRVLIMVSVEKVDCFHICSYINAIVRHKSFSLIQYWNESFGF